jgi:hypothetical protein
MSCATSKHGVIPAQAGTHDRVKIFITVRDLLYGVVGAGLRRYDVPFVTVECGQRFHHKLLRRDDDLERAVLFRKSAIRGAAA